MVEQLIVSMRQNEQCLQADRMRQRMLAENRWSAAEIDRRLALLPQTLPPNVLQRLWDEMFMIDLYPENRERFGVDWTTIVEIVIGK
jgi:hypothetical protein